MTLKYSRKIVNLEVLAETKATKNGGGFWGLIHATLRSRYLLASICFYLALIAFLGGVVVTHRVINNPSLFSPDRIGFIRPAPQRVNVPAPAARTKNDTDIVKQALDALPGGNASKAAPIKINAGRMSAIIPSLPQTLNQVCPAPVQLPDFKPATPLTEIIDHSRNERYRRVAEYQDKWVLNKKSGPFARDQKGASAVERGGDAGVARPGKNHDIIAEFVIFQAKYREGDWDCNGPYGTGTNAWNLSALKNLMHQVRKWSSDRIRPSVVPQVLDIGTDQIFTLKPPLIYLTGHKDFHFTGSEVRNLRDYINLGGCIWADAALAGRRSRFDIAFRREIKKVLPDRDFEILKPDHEMFNTYFRDVNLPAGINYCQEPAEIINVEEEMVVLYTLNGYGHFWESRIDRDGRIFRGPVNFGTAGQPAWHYAHGPHLGFPESSIIYRNISDESVRDAYKLGINLIVCLLTQYDDKTRFLPKSMPVMDARN